MIITKLLTTGALALALTLPAIAQGSGSQRTPDTRQTGYAMPSKRKPHTPHKRTIGYDLRKYRLRPCAPRKGDCVRAH